MNWGEPPERDAELKSGGQAHHRGTLPSRTDRDILSSPVLLYYLYYRSTGEPSRATITSSHEV
jgi:hypothetical protein